MPLDGWYSINFMNQKNKNHMPYVRKVNAIHIWRKFKTVLKPGSYVKNEFQFKVG